MLLRLAALSVKYIRELLMPLIPRTGKGTDGQDAESLVDGIVVGSTDKQIPHTHPPLVGIRVLYPHDISLIGELQTADKLVTVIGQYLAARVCGFYFRFHNCCKVTIFI